MPKFVIERVVPGAGKMDAGELRAMSRKSVGVLHELGPAIQWIHSYVAGDKIYCVYTAPDAETVRQHARLAGFPCNVVTPVAAIIDPTTAER